MGTQWRQSRNSYANAGSMLLFMRMCTSGLTKAILGNSDERSILSERAV